MTVCSSPASDLYASCEIFSGTGFLFDENADAKRAQQQHRLSHVPNCHAANPRPSTNMPILFHQSETLSIERTADGDDKLCLHWR